MRAKARTRRTTVAKSAVAASGVKFGACGRRRAITSSPTRDATSSKSVKSMPGTRVAFGDIGIIGLVSLICPVPW